MVLETITGFAVELFSGISANFASLPAEQLIIFDIAIILIVSAIFAFVAKMLKQPLIPVYVLAGLVIGPLVLGLVRNVSLIYAFSEIGIAFLLFFAGLEISFKKIKEANLKRIALIGILQVGIIFGIAMLLGHWLELNTLQAVYIGIILSFGSTMVDVKLLSDNGELVTMHGRLVLGILLLQDLIAIIAIALFMAGSFTAVPVIIAIAKLLIILGIAILLQIFVLNRLFKFAARSTELLLLSALAVLFLFVILTWVAELSIVIGAFIAGVSLANSPFKLELESRIAPLRDFFAILFFVALGMQIVFVGIGRHINLLIFLLVGAIVLKPIITFVLLRIFSYRPKTSFLTSVTLAQLSEFSLIIGMLGFSLGVIDKPILSTIILATIITIGLTPYFVDYKKYLHSFFKRPINTFKFLPINEEICYLNKERKSVLLIGAHRMGSIILKKLIKKDKSKLLVLDYNPDIINALVKKKISCIYGDLGSIEVLNSIALGQLKKIISTVPNFDDNIWLLRKAKGINKNIQIIVTASRISEAKELYDAGADYVIMPKVLAGEEITSILDKKDLGDVRVKHKREIDSLHRVLY